MGGFSSVSILIKIALGLCVAAILFDVIGFPTPYWSDSGISNGGLFQICVYGSCSDIPADRQTDEGKTVIALVIIGFLAGLVCLVLILCHIFVETLGTRIIKIVCMILAFVAALFTLVGVMIYGVKSENIGWSFILVIISNILYIITAVMITIDIVQG